MEPNDRPATREHRGGLMASVFASYFESGVVRRCAERAHFRMFGKNLSIHYGERESEFPTVEFGSRLRA